jgi:AbrB family looped-hinge helix DNA binding protein
MSDKQACVNGTTMTPRISRVGKRGTVVIPREPRRRLGIEAGSLIMMALSDGSIVLRPAVVLPVEQYPLERQAEFLLSNAVDADDYARAVEAVRSMGFDPETVPHYQPPA